MTETQITLYGADWCPDCRRSKRLLARLQIPYIDIDVDASAEASEFVKSKNNGRRTIPTIIFPDGTHLAEPSDPALEEKLRELGVLA